jgi:hypothetical protein
MPARLAAIPITQAERGAGTGADWDTERRDAERLEVMVARRTTGAATGLGVGLATPLKPMSPKEGETNGAWAADGAAIGRTTLVAGTLGLATVAVIVAADAGRANEATMPPETAKTAEALAAGLAEREIADESEEAGFSRMGAR